MRTCFVLHDQISEIASGTTPEQIAKSHAGWSSLNNQQWSGVQRGNLSMYSSQLPSFPADIYICGACSSTLDVARFFNENKILNEWDSILGLRQEKGRGQLRRGWESPEGNIYAAIRLPSTGFFANEIGSLAIGFLLARALQELGYTAQIKWPNDILVGDKKIGGILLEERAGILMAGIGLNVHSSPPAELLRNEWSIPASSLCKKEQTMPILQMWQTLVDYMHFCYNAQVVQYTTEKLISSVEKQLAWLGREVWIHGSDLVNRSGRIMGISQDGGLRLRQSSGEKIIHSGSISLHP
ncbi:biotin--[acetyl-CoA-carboxylase] ligase [Halodesulfovibrio marinisediminis]|uniref:biotin--[biotin carboxyl-carrier protein] ligase n=1 Tax=Halodesulfovibrio marinisediminis DSM 17456 TaxID=1121457 RepID=A0A1N6E6N0_9BACT|nr:biotin--[acetyl-CoA-carboxylase] ligase [Halodesulfovibrio marinisediminis]SIN78664.1 BirA family transcriptional regulator, biotin operon repressor / biotin-[acetyl-CoA-carboxylase] ligase [Halodesulfovibrio marinisediminis DSM 17456]